MMSVDKPVLESKVSNQGKNETARLRYIQWRDEFNVEKPYEIVSQVPSDFPPTNFSLDYGPHETIHDLRGQEQCFNLSDHGFEVRRHISTTVTFDKQSIEQEYLPSIKTFLENIFGSRAEICIFDWRVCNEIA